MCFPILAAVFSIRRVVALAALAAVLIPLIPAQAEAAKKDESKWSGKKLYMRKTCMACHGMKGRKAIQDIPNLAGQEKKYMINQINDIISGKRSASPDATGHPRTKGMQDSLVMGDTGKARVSKAQIKKISDYLSKQAPPKPKLKEPADPAKVKAGQKLYTKLKCHTCHGKNGDKPKRGYAYIAGQKKAYLVAQMTDLKSKVRKNGKSKLMFGFIKKASDDDIQLLAEYLSQVERKGAK